MKYFSYDENGDGMLLHNTVIDAIQHAQSAVDDENKTPGFRPFICYGRVDGLAVTNNNGDLSMRDQRRTCVWRDSIKGKFVNFFYNNARFILTALSASLMIWFLTTLSPDS